MVSLGIREAEGTHCVDEYFRGPLVESGGSNESGVSQGGERHCEKTLHLVQGFESERGFY